MNHYNNIKTAILEGDTIEARGWTIRVNASDEIEVWPPKGNGFVTGLTHLDRAVSDFCRKADIPVPGINEQQSDVVSLPDDMLDKDSETNKSIGKEPTEINEQTDPMDQPGSDSSNRKLTRDTEQKNPSGSNPAINKRPKPRDFGMSDPNLDPDTSNKEMKMGTVRSNRIIDTFDNNIEIPKIYREMRARRPSKELLDGIMDPEGWTARQFFKGAVGVNYNPKINEQQKDAIDVDDPEDMAGTYDRKRELDEKALPEFRTSRVRKSRKAELDMEGCEYKKGEAPPGEKWEKMVLDLKKDPDVENPYAVVWSKYNEEKGKSKKSTRQAGRDNWETLVDLADEGGEEINALVNFISQVDNGGIQQWIENGFDNDDVRRTLVDVAEKIGISSFSDIIDDLPFTDSDDWYDEESGELNEEGEEVVYKLDKLDDQFYSISDEVIKRAVELFKGDKTAGTKIREKWLQDGGYNRDIEAETAEELHNLTRALGGDEVDWSSMKPKKPEEQDAEDRVEAKKAGWDDEEEYDSKKDPYSGDYEETAEDLAESWLNGNRKYVIKELVRRSEDEKDLFYDVYELLPEEDRRYIHRKFFEDRKGSKDGNNSDIEAVDDKAKDYWTKYMGDYGKQLTKGDSTKKKEKPDGKKDKKGFGRSTAQAMPQEEPAPAAPAPAPKTPAAPAPKTPTAKPPVDKGQLAPGTGDSGLTSLGWTEEDIKGMSDEDKQKILQVKLNKPGTTKNAPKAPTPKQKEPVPAPAPQQQTPQPIPIMPDQQKPTPTARRAQQVEMESAPQQQQLVEQAAPTKGPSSDDERAFQILKEVQQMEVTASSPEQVTSMKASTLAERLLKEVGMTISDAKKLFGVEGKNLFSIL